MAVYAAHLTRTLHGAPSVFQVGAQDALADTIKPALRKLVEYVSAVYPNSCGWAPAWYDELYLLCDCFLQYHYLKHYAASFSESFYGLLRVPVAPSGEFSSGQRLPSGLERASLALLVLLPYLRDRAERLVERWREDREEGRLGKTGADSARRLAVTVYSGVHLACESARLAQLCAYLCGRVRSPTPALALLGLALRDAPPQPAPEHTWADLARAILTGNIGDAVLTFPMLGSVSLRGAEYGAFCVQFLRWWEARGRLADAALPTPPTPTRDGSALRWRNRCPLCRLAWRVPTALPVSGYVFCYVCISRWVRAHAACPVTRLPAAERDLVRVYADH